MAEKKRKIYYTENAKKRNERWNKANLVTVTVRYHHVNDADVIEKVNSVPNKADYIRQLIRADIKRQKDAALIKKVISESED